MHNRELLILWHIHGEDVALLPSAFAHRGPALFWAEVFMALMPGSIIVDAVPASDLIRHLETCDWASAISEEAFENAYRNMEAFCRHSGGLTKGSGMEGRIDPNGTKFQKEGERILLSGFGR